ncbi:Hypothetical predicted protein [Olea europaea subsp. europaea]|uniref:Uncharacterized protein n=1 Tax=Olea europaea subsp. europaea TaxID=158383 RepID=A0A8S0SEZ6_OLEEU|nr:Hypothetical predicted protein [Olea europaea subsp. europaea]
MYREQSSRASSSSGSSLSRRLFQAYSQSVHYVDNGSTWKWRKSQLMTLGNFGRTVHPRSIENRDGAYSSTCGILISKREESRLSFGWDQLREGGRYFVSRGDEKFPSGNFVSLNIVKKN